MWKNWNYAAIFFFCQFFHLFTVFSWNCPSKKSFCWQKPKPDKLRYKIWSSRKCNIPKKDATHCCKKLALYPGSIICSLHTRKWKIHSLNALYYSLSTSNWGAQWMIMLGDTCNRQRNKKKYCVKVY